MDQKFTSVYSNLRVDVGCQTQLGHHGTGRHGRNLRVDVGCQTGGTANIVVDGCRNLRVDVD